MPKHKEPSTIEGLVMFGSVLCAAFAATGISVGILGMTTDGFGTIQPMQAYTGESAHRVSVIMLAIGVALVVLAIFGFRYSLPALRKQGGNRSFIDEIRDKRSRRR